MSRINRMAYTHCHTAEGSNLRMLDSTTTVKQLINRACELNATAIAITDHESLSGHIAAINYIKDLRKQGKESPKLILGNEIYLVDEVYESATGGYYCDNYYHFILLAKNKEGHNQLRTLSSEAWENSFYDRGMERVPTTKKNLKKVIEANKGNLIATTACIGGELGKNILLSNTDYTDLPFGNEQDKAELKKAVEKECNVKIDRFLNYCIDVFGDDFYLEIQPSNSEDQVKVNKAIIELSQQYNIPFTIACDSHYTSAEKRNIHASYLNSRDEERELGDFYATTYNMSPDEIHEFLDWQIGFENVEIGLQNSNIIAEKISEYDLFHTQVVPKATIPEFQLIGVFEQVYERYPYIGKFAHSDNVSDQYFLYLIENGFLDKECGSVLSVELANKLASRINDELEAIWESSVKINDNVASYYLTALEIVQMMWDDSEDGGGSLVGPSRGSIASFYTAYLIGLQQINPVKYDIPYWRHLKQLLILSLSTIKNTKERYGLII